jgi:hypothetical protein
MSNLSEQQQDQEHQEQPHPRLGVVTIHDACPAFSTRIFESADELEKYMLILIFSILRI